MKHVAEYETTKWLSRILLKDAQIQALGKQTKMFKNKFLTVITRPCVLDKRRAVKL